jgi:Leucine Rich repeat
MRTATLVAAVLLLAGPALAALTVDPAFNAAVTDLTTMLTADPTKRLVATIGVNTTLNVVWVGHLSSHQKAIHAALADTEGRFAGRERFLREQQHAAETAVWRTKVDRVLREGKDRVDLQQKGLGADGAVEVAEKLRGTSNAVKTLYLEDNKIGDGGARSFADLLRSNPPVLEEVDLGDNNIGRDGIAALADALRENTTLRRLELYQNKGVDPRLGGTEAEAAAGIDSLVASIGVNTALEEVCVHVARSNPHQKTIDAVLADTEGRCAGRERFLSTPMTKAARRRD